MTVGVANQTLGRHAPEDRLFHNGEYYSVKILTKPWGKFIACGMREYFRGVGISVDIVEAIDEGDVTRNVLYIVMFAFLYDIPSGLRYVVYQLEQKQQSPWFNDKYRKILNGSAFIFDYSVQNYQHMELPLQKKTAFLPIPLHLATEEYHHFEHDVLFYGSLCPRRERILSDLQDKHGIKIKIVSAAIGEVLDELIQKSRIVLNLHYYENALLETTRINEALQWGRIVVSEDPMAEDKLSRQLYRDVVVFTKNLDNYDDRHVEALAKTLKFYTNSENYRRYVQGRKETLNSLQRYCFGRFTKALLSIQAFSPTRFYQSLNNGIVHYMSLDESWENRRETFLRQPHLPANLKRIAAIKATPEWLGSGISYKFAINSARLSGLDQVTICEDTVEFASTFERDYRIIREYLSTVAKWDIFVGLITDINDSTRILDVQRYKGFEFVTIDKFPNTFCNIYKDSSFNHLMSWDEHDTNAGTNTIDKYLQNVNLTVITLNKKLMNIRSTSWEKSREYPEWFDTSVTKAFSKKVHQFKLTRSHNSQA